MVFARDVMQKHFVGVSKSTRIASALKLASSAKVDVMPVIDDDRLSGIVTTSDIERNRDADFEVGQIMSDPIFIEANTRLEDATGVMIKHGLGRIPVVEDKFSMRCIGMLTSTDIVNASKKS